MHIRCLNDQKTLENSEKVASDTSTFLSYFVQILSNLLHLLEIRSKRSKKVLVTDAIIFCVQQLFKDLYASKLSLNLTDKARFFSDFFIFLDFPSN